MSPVGVTVNGAEHFFTEELSVRELLRRLDLPERGVALAVDGAVYPKSRVGRRGAAGLGDRGVDGGAGWLTRPQCR